MENQEITPEQVVESPSVQFISDEEVQAAQAEEQPQEEVTMVQESTEPAETIETTETTQTPSDRDWETLDSP